MLNSHLKLSAALASIKEERVRRGFRRLREESEKGEGGVSITSRRRPQIHEMHIKITRSY